MQPHTDFEPRRRPAALRIALPLLAIAACVSPREPADRPAEEPRMTESPVTAPAALTGREWRLLTFGDRPAPLGAGGRPATLSFDLSDGRAGGFSGCNSYSASYTTAGDSLAFGQAVSTMMACAEGMELEQQYLAALQGVRRFAIEDSMLVLIGADGPVLRFQPGS